MDWLKITIAAALVAMFFYLLPSAKRMVKNAPKGSSKDWMSFIVPLAFVALVVIVLVSMV
jgi:hypothetical protein